MPPPPPQSFAAAAAPVSPEQAGSRGVAAAARPTGARAPWVAVELGAIITQRRLRFERIGVGAAQLREYTARSISGPQVHLEIHPAAPFTEGLGAGVGLFGSYARSVNLETRTGVSEQRPS